MSGPLQSGGATSYFDSTGIPMSRAGQVVTFAHFALPNHGGRPAVIDKVSLVPPPKGDRVRLVSSFVAYLKDGASAPEEFVALQGPARKYYQHPKSAEGVTIPPHPRGEYVLGVVVAAPRGFLHEAPARLAVAEGIQVAYHVGNNHYVDRWPNQIILCPRECDSWDRKNGRSVSKWPAPPTFRSR